MIKLAQDRIDEATRRLAEIDRELADLQRQLRQGSKLGWYGITELKAAAALVRQRRDLAQPELLEGRTKRLTVIHSS
jgi:hypothetical protein